MAKSDATALVAEVERLLASPSMSLYPAMRDRLNVLSVKMAAAAELLPEVAESYT